MDVNSIKIGTVGRFHFRKVTAVNPTTGAETAFESDVAGVVVVCPNENNDTYYVIDELGKQKGFRKKELQSVSSIRIGKEIRAQFAIIAKEYENLHKMEAEKKKIESAIWNTRNKLKVDQAELAHISGYYTSNEFDNKICEFGFRVSGSRKDGDSVYVMLQQSDNGTRYSKPDVSREFPFVYQEYDGCCFLREEHAPKEYKRFLEKNAPAIIPALAKMAKSVEQCAEVGDKYIYATTNYWVFLKNGYTKKNVDAIIDIMKRRI